MTELTFLLELLLNHKLPKSTKEAIAARIKEVEEKLSQPNMHSMHTRTAPAGFVPPHLANQAPSTIAAMMKHEMAPPTAGPVLESVPLQTPAVIAQTPAAQAAVSARQEAINLAVSGKLEKGRTSPRKF